MNKVLLVLFASSIFLLEGPQPPLWASGSEEVLYVSPIVKQKMKVHDTERDKDIEVSMWYKGILRKDQKRDLIVLSHGWTGNPDQFEWVVKNLVDDGYFVIGPKHQDLLPSKEPHVNHWNRPLDISLSLDGFLSSMYGKYIDQDNIGMIGFSLGATTSIWVAGGRCPLELDFSRGKEYASEKEFNRVVELSKDLDMIKVQQSYKDDRIKAVFLMAPAWTWIFDENSLKNISIPVYAVGAEKDEIVNTDKNMGHLSDNIPGMTSQTIPEAGHFVFIERANEKDRMNDPVREEISKEVLAFFQKSLQ